MEWGLDITLILLLAVTLFHALRLERALGVLKRDRAELEALITGFNDTTRQAEQGIDRLRQTADGAGRQIAKQIEVASGLKDDLIFLSERSDRLAERLDILVRTARPMAAEVHPADLPMARPIVPEIHPTAPVLTAEQLRPTCLVPARPAPAEVQDDDPSPRRRSQAERDLLRALKMAQ
jgi:hypothetical protein